MNLQYLTEHILDKSDVLSLDNHQSLQTFLVIKTGLKVSWKILAHQNHQIMSHGLKFEQNKSFLKKANFFQSCFNCLNMFQILVPEKYYYQYKMFFL
jgi:hypothetical protein